MTRPRADLRKSIQDEQMGLSDAEQKRLVRCQALLRQAGETVNPWEVLALINEVEDTCRVMVRRMTLESGESRRSVTDDLRQRAEQLIDKMTPAPERQATINEYELLTEVPRLIAQMLKSSVEGQRQNDTIVIQNLRDGLATAVGQAHRAEASLTALTAEKEQLQKELNAERLEVISAIARKEHAMREASTAESALAQMTAEREQEDYATIARRKAQIEEVVLARQQKREADIALAHWRRIAEMRKGYMRHRPTCKLLMVYVGPPVQLQDQASAPEWTCQHCGNDMLFCGCACTCGCTQALSEAGTAPAGDE